MKNSEKPINPLPSGVDSSKVECIGLTKREHFVSLAMQALASNPDWTKSMLIPDDWEEYIKRLSVGAVELADALLEVLQKDKS